MSNPEFATRLHELIKRTLSPQQSSDQDIVAYIKMVGEKRVKNLQNDSQTEQMLKQIITNPEVINKIIGFLREESQRSEEKKRAQKIEKEQQLKKQIEKNQIQNNPVVATQITTQKNRRDENKKQQNISQKQFKNNKNNQNNKNDKITSNRKRQQPPITYQNNQPSSNKQEKGSIFDRMADKKQSRPKHQQKRKVQKQTEDITLKPDLEGKTKCRFFPFCKNQQCEFFHPTQKCPHFPHCKFKQKCLFVHEICKFGESCTRMDCFYEHPGKKKNDNSLMAMMKMMMAKVKPNFKGNKKPAQAAERAFQ